MSKNDGKFRGGRLRLARIIQGLTLEEIGKNACVSRQYIQRIESNLSASPPSKELVDVLAEILHVEPEFFYEPLTGELREESCRFRKQKSTPKHIRSRAISYGTIFNLIIRDLENEFEFPPVNIPSATVISPEDIEKSAKKCRLCWGLLADAPILNMVRTLERFGAVVTVFEGVSDKIDAFSYENDNRPVVVRNLRKKSRSRARFDLAHELGHLVLHRGMKNKANNLEEEANRFASAFLLPKEAFFREFPKSIRINWERLVLMKIRWGVSLQAIIRRAYHLGIITAVQYRNANIYIGRKGWKTSEPGEKDIPVENPEIVPTCFEMLTEQGISPEDVAHKLRITLPILEKFGLSFGHLCRKQDTEGKVLSLEKARLQRITE